MKELDTSPYISLNGVRMTADKKKIVKSDASKNLRGLGYATLFGVQVSEKTQVNDIENKYGRDWYPVGNRIAYAAGNCWPGETILHINSDNADPDYIGLFAKYMYERAYVLGFGETDLGSSYAETNNYIDGFQLNRLPWHETEYMTAFERLRKSTSISRLILQASNMQLETLAPIAFAKQLKKYDEHVSAVLIDGSSGTGTLLDTPKTSEYIDACEQEGLRVNIAVAGGLNASTVPLTLPEIVQKHSNISFDAESGLRDDYTSADPSKSSFSTKKAIEFTESILHVLS